MNSNTDVQVEAPFDLRNFARRAVAYCITQTVFRHAGQQVFLNTFPNTRDGLVEQARLSKLTHEELSNLSQNERFGRFRAAFLNDADMDMTHDLFRKLNIDFRPDMERHLEEYWKLEEKRLLEYIKCGVDDSNLAQ